MRHLATSPIAARPFALRPLLLPALLLLGWLGLPADAAARIRCEVDASTDLDFGVPGMPIGPVQTTSQVTVSCDGNRSDAGESALVCIGVDGYTHPRTMRQQGWPFDSLRYDIYRDPARTEAVDFTVNASRVLTVGPGGAPVSHTFTLYGQLAAPQPTPTADDYRENVTGVMGYTTAGGATCDSAPLADYFYFQARARLPGSCTVVANDLGFGLRSSLSANVDASTTIGLSCTPGTHYRVRLNGGTVAGNVAARRMGLAGSPPGVIAYQLYRDPSRTQVWGDGSAGTVEAVGTGTGNPVTLTVYGRVPAQSTPPAGYYQDVVTATVVY